MSRTRLLSAAAGAVLLLSAASCAAPTTTGTTGSASPTSPELSGAAACAAGQGEVQRIASINDAYGDSGDYQVYLPPCYGTDPATRYPVLYLLHGAGHDDVYWLEVGVHRAADDAIAKSSIEPMIIVMPDGGPTFRSPTSGAPSFKDYLTHSIVPDVDSRWHTLPDRQHRAIGGISLGGGRALEIAGAVPDLFGSVGGHSAAVAGSDALTRQLATAHLRIYLDVGDQDSLRSADEALSSALDELGTPHEFHIGHGSHEEAYWTAHLEEYLAFYDAGFSGG